MKNFNEMKKSASDAIQMLNSYHDCIAWIEYSDKGNPCYDPYDFASQADREDDALWHAAVKVAIPKGSHDHTFLADLIAKELSNQWITYDWLIKAIARVLNGATLAELKKMCELSRVVKNRMEAKGLTKINSFEEALDSEKEINYS